MSTQRQCLRVKGWRCLLNGPLKIEKHSNCLHCFLTIHSLPKKNRAWMWLEHTPFEAQQELLVHKSPLWWWWWWWWCSLASFIPLFLGEMLLLQRNTLFRSHRIHLVPPLPMFPHNLSHLYAFIDSFHDEKMTSNERTLNSCRVERTNSDVVATTHWLWVALPTRDKLDV